ncbi:hypothetical protein ACFYOV_18920 [Streptomyces sp. NPDC005931]|uniref:hypothetical protein n=1 Tax=Streptomyces sp. NPDC005931 TaxID=3364737 RepID=UPI0036C06D20
MAGFRSLLRRFRPVASPGGAAPVGVPADRSAELRAELAPPLLLLEQVQAEARFIREQAGAQAAARRDETEQRAREIVAEAHREAQRVRTRTAERTVRAAEAEAAVVRTRAEREVAGVAARARGRMPALADRVRATVLTDAMAGALPATRPRGRRAPGRDGPEEDDR